MKTATSELSSEDVLNAFAVEPSHGRDVLEEYLRNYPQYALELALLSHELSREDVESSPLTTEDQATIDEAWKQYSSPSLASSVNLFAELSVPQLRDLAARLSVPRQIITAFRERKVIVSSIPKRFLGEVAVALNTTIEQITSALTMPTEINYSRSYKADEKPVAVAPATFEQLLIDANVAEEKRAELMNKEK